MSQATRPTRFEAIGASVVARFDEDGVVLSPIFASSIRLGWDEIEYVCKTEITITGRDLLQTRPSSYRLLDLAVVVRDRRPLLARVPGWWSRVNLSGVLRPMLGVDDERLPDQSMFRVEVRERRGERPIEPLLELIGRHCRFGLVVDF